MHCKVLFIFYINPSSISFQGYNDLCAGSPIVHQYNTTTESSIVLGEVHCVGNESELLECPHEEHVCTGIHSAILPISISCYGITTQLLLSAYCTHPINLDCDDGDVKLHGGSNYSSIGHVYYCVNRTWVGVCSDGWDRDEIGVVCRQLHYYPEGVCACELESIDVSLLIAPSARRNYSNGGGR